MDDSSSTETQFQQITPWSESQLSAIMGYAEKLFHQRSERGRDANSLIAQPIREVFVVAAFQQLDHERNEILAAFIHFLLHVLHQRTNRIDSFLDRIDKLRKELRFLVTFLGDEVLLTSGDGIERAGNVLGEVETEANEAGRLVYSLIFTLDVEFVATRMDEDLVALSGRMSLLRDNIIGKFLIPVPDIVKLDNASRSNIGDVNLFCIVDSLLCDLEDLMNCGDDRIFYVKEIEIVHQGLMFCQSLLKDMNLPRNTDTQELKEAAMRISDVAYEAEYLITSFLVGDAPIRYLTIRLGHVIYKIELIGTRLQEIKKKYDSGALEAAKEKDCSAQISPEANRYSEVDGFTVGFEDKATYILDQLVGGSEHLRIVSIFGMPGIGKTTFARKLYNHPLVDYYFDKCMWCIVSQTYQRRSLLTDILAGLEREIDRVRISNMEEESLAERIYKSLKGRRYLIVLDDIWDSSTWNDLRRCFPDDRNGSRILFTSRNKDVAPPGSKIYPLPFLSDDQCWKLLEKKLFHNKPCPPQVVEIGKKIAANCNGLPLVVVVMAGILSAMLKEGSTWENVGARLNSHVFFDKMNDVMQILELSYKHLPEYLKPCFLYFGAFPEDTEIPVKKLKWLWIAEGFVRRQVNKSAESVAEEYLMELIDRSLIIVTKKSSNGGAKACVAHDLFRDLCLRIAEEENFLKLLDHDNSIYLKHHHLCIHWSHFYGGSREFSLPFGFHVRSILASRLYSSLYVSDMKLLRVLDLPNGMPSNGDGIELLANLRYLAVYLVPMSIVTLVNLEFLIVNAIEGGLVFMSSIIPKMVKLRYLRVYHLENFSNECNNSQTNNLEYLSYVRIKKLTDEEMLRRSPHLRKLKCTCKPLSEEKGAYRYPDLRFLTQLESLNMTNSHRHGRTVEINFPSNIKKLTLSGLRLPWEKMSKVGGLPNLEVLKLASDAFVGDRWDTRDGEFQQLRFLKMNTLKLVEWNVALSEHFPKLQQLVLHRCYNLQEIPCEMGEISTLQLIEVTSCRETVVKSAVQIEEEQRDMGNEELKVILRRIRG